MLGLVASGVAVAPGAVASSAQTSTTVPPTTLPGSTAIDVNMAFTGATITSPADPTNRALNGYQTAVFVQSWLPEAIYGKPELRDPPANLPVYRVDIMGSWGGAEPQVGNQSVYYASDGRTAFLSYPQDQAVTPTAANVPPPSNWFIAPGRTVDAFNGTATLVETAGVDNAAHPRTPVPQTTSGSGSSTSTPWVLYGVLVAAGIVIVVGMVRHFRRAPAD